MADYQLTQTGSEVQALLNDIASGEFVRTADMTDIPANSDLNNYKTAGTYHCTANADVVTIANCPASVAFQLVVKYTVGSASPTQEVTSYEGDKYIRTYRSWTSSWGDWTSFQPALTYTTYVNMLDTIPANPTSATTASYTVPNNGWVYMYATRGSTAGNSLFLSVNGVTCYTFPAYDAYAVVAIIIPVTRGQTLKFTSDSANATWTIRQLHFSR